MHSFLLRALIFLLPSCAYAQLEDGSFAPDFTLQDLNGHTWHLYDLLEDGKHVILDFSATWCTPCWDYHESGELNQAYSMYGPEGTDELMIFMIEGDEQTNLDCLYDLPGCSFSTKGDWTAGTLFPIINDDFIADVYEIQGWPTHFHICPNKIISRTDRPGLETIEYFLQSCTEPVGQHNASIESYTSYTGAFCHSFSTSPAILIQNLGNQPMESATAECYVNGELQTTISWEGHVIPFDTFTLSLPEITITEEATVLVRITSVNGVTDDDQNDNEIDVQFTPTPGITENILQLELKTNFKPQGVYWEVINGDSTVLYSGGNPTIIGKEDNGGTYTALDSVYRIPIPLPGDGCYKFTVYDANDANAGVDYYKITGPSGELLAQAPYVPLYKEELFNIQQANHPIANNGAISKVSGLPAAFCSRKSYSISIDLQNLGEANITQAEIEILENDQLLMQLPWSGNILKGEHATITFPALSFTTGKNIVIRIKSVNETLDEYAYQNEWTIDLPHNSSKDNVILMKLKLDPWAYENYWQLTNSSGDVMYAGGNTTVGPTGGGLKNASENDPGAYVSGALVQLELSLPDMSDCYTFLMVDSYGNGLYTGGYVTFSEEETAKLIYSQSFTAPFNETEVLIEVDPLEVSIESESTLEELVVFPNPASMELQLRIETKHLLPLTISVINVMGEPVLTFPEFIYSPGVSSQSIDLHDLDEGLYIIQFVSGDKIWTRKVAVVNQ